MSGSIYTLAYQATLDSSKYADGAAKITKADKDVVASGTQVAEATGKVGAALTATERVIGAQASSVERLNRQYIDGYGAAAKMTAALESYERALAKGTVTPERAVAGMQGIASKFGATITTGSLAAGGNVGLAAALASLGKNGQVVGQVGKDFEISARETHEFANSVRETASALAMGVPPVQAMGLGAMRLGHVLGDNALLFGAVGAGIAAVVGGVSILVEHWRALNEEAERFGTATAAYRSSLTTQQLQGMVPGLRQYGASRSDADQALVSLTAARGIPQSLAGPLAGAAAPLAEATSRTVPDAMKELVSAAGEGYQGIVKLEQAYGMLTPAEMESARRMTESGHAVDAVRMAVDALDRQMTDAAEHAKGPAAKAWEEAGLKISKALDDIAASSFWNKISILTAQGYGGVGDFLGGVAALVSGAATAPDSRSRFVFQPGSPGARAGLGPVAAYDPLSSVAVPPSASIAGAAPNLDDINAASDIRARFTASNAAARLGGIEGDRASVIAEADQKYRGLNETLQKQAEIEGRLAEITARNTGAVRDEIRAAQDEASVSEAVARGYDRSAAAAANARIDAEANNEVLRKGVDATLAQALAEAKLRAEVLASIAANAQRINQFKDEEVYRQRELAAAGQGPAALNRERARSTVDQNYAPQLANAAVSGGVQDIDKLVSQRTQEEDQAVEKLAQDLQLASAATDERLSRELAFRQQELSLMGENATQRAKELAQTQTLNDLLDAGYSKDSQALTDEYNKRVALNEQIAQAVAQTQQAKKDNEQWQRTTQELTSHLEDDFERAITSGKSFHDVVKGLKQDLLEMVEKYAVFNPLNNLINGMLPGAGSAGQQPSIWSLFGAGGNTGLFGAGSGASSWFGNLFGGASAGISSGVDPALAGGGGLSSAFSWIGDLFADGGIMTSRGRIPLRAYAAGGVATSPQAAIFGEGSVPEAYVPVPSGRIPVQLSGGGGITQHIYVEGGSDMNMVRRAIETALRTATPNIQAGAVKMSRVASVNDVYARARNGGSFAAALGNG